jgi:hypothetical protein
MTTLQLSDQKLSIGKQVETYIFEAMVNCWNGDVRVVLVFKQLAVGESEVPLVLSISAREPSKFSRRDRNFSGAR